MFDMGIEQEQIERIAQSESWLACRLLEHVTVVPA